MPLVGADAMRAVCVRALRRRVQGQYVCVCAAGP